MGDRPCCTSYLTKTAFRGQAATLERLRVDRQLEEALALGSDPLHLTAIFGLDPKTAIRYADNARQLLITAAEEQDPATDGLRKTRDRLVAAQQRSERGADGLYALEADTGLIIAHGSWAAREDFERFIHVGPGITVTAPNWPAGIDWEAAITALDAGEFPASSGEKRMLRLAASLAWDIPVRLGEAFTWARGAYIEIGGATTCATWGRKAAAGSRKTRWMSRTRNPPRDTGSSRRSASAI